MNRIELPTTDGAYRWYYVDATAGDFTAVAIFMIGSLFSARYAAAGGAPRHHAAVNFALYQRGVRRVWVLSEYGDLAHDDTRLCIGGSSLQYRDGGLTLEVNERTAWWGRPVRARIELETCGPTLAPLRLKPDASHFWHPVALRASATVTVPSHGLQLAAHAYHDGNHGDAPLAGDLRGWDWVRTHAGKQTSVTYRPWGEAAPLAVTVGEQVATVTRPDALAAPRARTGWGLGVPRSLGLDARPALLESSPFYARLEARHEGAHALAEVADFERFQSRWIRWMARLRTRVEAGA